MRLKMGFGTQAVHAGKDEHDRAHTPPIYRCASWEIRSDEELQKCFEGEIPLYGRLGGNPTHRYAEEKICVLEGGAAAFLTSSGMSAVSMSIRGALWHKRERHIIWIGPMYGKTYDLCMTLEKEGHGVTFIPADTPRLPERVYDAMTPKTEVVGGEFTTNPTIYVWDVPAVFGAVGEYPKIRAKRIVDVSFSGPFNFRAFDHGADVAVYSATKGLSAHGAQILGFTVISHEGMERHTQYWKNCYDWMTENGVIAGADDAWLLGMFMKTIHLREPVRNQNAAFLAEFLDSHSAVQEVLYPGIKSTPQYALAEKLMRTPYGIHGFGGMLSFRIRGGLAAAKKFLYTMNRETFVKHKPSLGYVETIIESPWLLSQRSMKASHQKMFNISKDSIRVSAGVEDRPDIRKAFEHGLNRSQR